MTKNGNLKFNAERLRRLATVSYLHHKLFGEHGVTVVHVLCRLCLGVSIIRFKLNLKISVYDLLIMIWESVFKIVVIQHLK